MEDLILDILFILIIITIWYIYSRNGKVKLNQYISLPGKIIFEKDFSNHSLGTYTHADAENDWPNASPYFQDNAFSIVKDGSKKVLSLTMPGGKYGAKYGGVFKVTIPPSEEAYISYNLKFKDGFDWRRGGKLHGLCGISTLCKAPDDCRPNTGKRKPTGNDGWSARFMWNQNGNLNQYVYHPDQSKDYGDSYTYMIDGERFVFETEKWYNITSRVVMNTPGKHDGLIEGWLNGKKVFSKLGFRFRDIPEIPINSICFSVFFGGSDSTWAPLNDSTVLFDDFRVVRIG